MKKKSKPLISMTHEEIAAELGTAREVVSRLLKEYEKEGLVETGRERIERVGKSVLFCFLERPRKSFRSTRVRARLAVKKACPRQCWPLGFTEGMMFGGLKQKEKV